MFLPFALIEDGRGRFNRRREHRLIEESDASGFQSVRGEQDALAARELRFHVLKAAVHVERDPAGRHFQCLALALTLKGTVVFENSSSEPA